MPFSIHGLHLLLIKDRVLYCASLNASPPGHPHDAQEDEERSMRVLFLMAFAVAISFIAGVA